MDKPNWLQTELQLGQVGGLVTDDKGFLFVFHRAERQWTARSFDESNRFTEQADGPIQRPTLLIIDPGQGVLVHSWGSGM